MKAYRPPLVGSLFVASMLVASTFYPAFADNMATSVPASESTNPTKMLVFTAGASLVDGYKTFKVSGGTGNISFALYDAQGTKEARLPADLTFGADGVIRGTVPLSGFNPEGMLYTIKAFDEGGGVTSKKVGFKINPPLDVIAEPIRLTAGGNIVVPIYPFKISGGTGKIDTTFVDKAGAPVSAPGRLAFGKEGGITGRAPDDATELNGMQVRITDEGGAVIARNISWIINPPMTAEVMKVVLTAGGVLPRDLIPVKVTGGTSAIKLSIFEKDGSTPAALPDGIVFNEINGSLAGNVSLNDAMEKHYVVKAVDQGGGVLDAKFTLQINKRLEMSDL
ncbi:MAG: hypothetical protein IT497_00775 [Ottowia sp.]|nr:hypothetical protein [Ottowia sp.]